MTVAELTTLFKSQTGRLDLSDADILLLLNQSCKLLDQLEDSEKRNYRVMISLEAGGYIAALPSEFRFWKSVILHSAENAKVIPQADPAIVMAAIRGIGADLLDGETYCAVVNTGLYADSSINLLPFFADIVGIQTQLTDHNQFVIVYPAVTEYTVLEVESSAFTATLSATQTTNYWTLRYPDLVLDGVNYILLKNLLSSAAAADILKDLRNRVLCITYDFYSQENINQIGG